jgi:hypothetical protein
MAYMSQEHKAKLAPTVKAICKKYNVKASLAVRNHSTLVLNIKSGDINFIENYIFTDTAKPHANKMTADQIEYLRTKKAIDVNPHWYQEHFSGKSKAFLKEVIAAMYGPDYFDHSDSQTDYFHCSHYIDVNIGRWNAPYALVK